MVDRMIHCKMQLSSENPDKPKRRTNATTVSDGVATSPTDGLGSAAGVEVAIHTKSKKRAVRYGERRMGSEYRLVTWREQTRGTGERRNQAKRERG